MKSVFDETQELRWYSRLYMVCNLLSVLAWNSWIFHQELSGIIWNSEPDIRTRE